MERERTDRSTRSTKGRQCLENMLERAYVFMGAPGSSTVTHQNLCDVSRHQLTHSLICLVLGIPKPVLEYPVGTTWRTYCGGTHGPSSSQKLWVFCFLVTCTWFSTLGGGLCRGSVPGILGEALGQFTPTFPSCRQNENKVLHKMPGHTQGELTKKELPTRV